MPLYKVETLCRMIGEDYVIERMNRVEELQLTIASVMNGSNKEIKEFKKNLIKGLEKDYSNKKKKTFSKEDLQKSLGV